MLVLAYVVTLLPLSACMTLPSMKREVIELSKQLWHASSEASPIEHERLVAKVTELEHARPISKPIDHLHLLDGLWRTVYSNLDILNLRTLPNLTFNALPDPSSTYTEPAILQVQDSYQVFSST